MNFPYKTSNGYYADAGPKLYQGIADEINEMKMKGILITVCSVLFAINAIAQDDPDQLPFDVRSQQYSPARLFGKVLAGKSRKGVEAASIQVFVKSQDSLG